MTQFKKKGKPYKDKNINEISNALGEKLRSFETITKKEHDEFRKRMREFLQKRK
tara:strand:+ start:1100 stop:1261 length:162 start_codon:yes stop_codon:yes gene_type:complete